MDSAPAPAAGQPASLMNRPVVARRHGGPATTAAGQPGGPGGPGSRGTWSTVEQPLMATMPDALTHGVLTAEDEIDLAKRIEAGLYAAHLLAAGGHDDATAAELEWLVEDGRAARTRFIESNLRLAFATSRRYWRRGVSTEDVLQDAYHGLVRAVDKFDYRKGFKFSTYAVWWIREAVMTGVRHGQFVKYPEARFNQINKVAAVRLRLLDETGDPPTLAQIAAETGLSEEQVENCLRADRATASLDAPLAEDLTLAEVLSDEDATASLVAVEAAEDRRLLNECLTIAMSLLPARDLYIIRARFGLDGKPPRTVAAVARELDMPGQTVRFREQRAMHQLRRPSALAMLEGFRATA